VTDVVGFTRRFTYTGKATTCDWTRYGIKIHFPDCDDKTQIIVTIVNVRIHPSTIKLPENTELASGIYSITSSHPFRKPVILELEHDLGAEEETSKLRFVTSPEGAKFEILHGGKFKSGCRYGSISLPHFSLFGIVVNRISQQAQLAVQQVRSFWRNVVDRLTSLMLQLVPSTQQQAPVHRYSCTYFRIHQRNYFEVHMMITRDLEVCKRVS